MKRSIFIFFVVLLLVLVGIPKVSSSFNCVTDLNSSSTKAQRQYCQNELNILLAQVAVYKQQLSSQQKQTGTIKGDLNYLTGQIRTLNLKIRSSISAIDRLKSSINYKISTIETLSQKIENKKKSLAQLLRNTNEIDNENLIDLLFSNNTLSSFYSDLEAYDSIKQEIRVSIDSIRGIKTKAEYQKIDLQKQKNVELNVKTALERDQKKVSVNESNKKQLLITSKQKESKYQNIIIDRQKRARDIKARLFQLAGGSSPIKFALALSYAEDAQARTGIDPAFLLAILTQESRLGANVGKCYLTNSSTGRGISSTGKIWPNLMNVKRDVPPFLEITNSLGFNAFKTVVSCPIAGIKGYGGAMGPAQFIPSTWKLFEKRVSAITGSKPANPWSAKDAFIASSLYLTDLGAKGTSTSAQKKAACRYYGSGGSNCSYSRRVISLRDKIQSDINYLKKYGVTKK